MAFTRVTPVYPARRARPLSLTVATWLLAGASAFGCAKGIPAASGGTGGHTGGSGTGGTQTGGGTGGALAGTGGTVTGAGGVVGTGGSGIGGYGVGGGTFDPDAGMDANCQMASYKFVPKIPNVFLLVDGSGSMFNADSTIPQGNRWSALRAALLPVIQNLQDEVNFGLGIFSGVTATNECPIFITVPIAKSNYTPIMSAYPSARLRQESTSLESPVTQVLPMIPAIFASAPKTGDNYMLFATDGEPDFCDNGNATCPVDATVSGVHQLALAGIYTYVMGLASNINSGTCPNVLDAYANAGASLPIANPCGTHNIPAECTAEPHWKAIATQLSRPAGTALVDYVATGGNAKVFSPNIADQTSLTNALASAFSGVKSCTFDLGNVSGQSIHVDLTQLGSAHVLIEKTEIPQNDSNGWRMTSTTQLELVGTACTTWRSPNNNNIDFRFPCQSIIFE